MTKTEREDDLNALIAATPNLVAEINAVKEVVSRLAALAARDAEARSFLGQPVDYKDLGDPEAEAFAGQVSQKIRQIVSPGA